MIQFRSRLKVRSNVLKRMMRSIMILSLIFGGAGNVFSAFDPYVGGGYEELQVLKGDIETIRTSGLKRVSITDPGIADINDARAKAIEIMGISSGQTILFIWDESGKRTVVIRVVTENLDFVKKRIQSLMKSAGINELVINENTTEGKLIITGKVPANKADMIKGVVEPFGDRIINLTQPEKVEDLVQIDAQVTELTTTLAKEFGVNWSPDTLTYTENAPAETHIPRSSGSFRDLFKIGDFSRSGIFMAKINALVSESKGKILSKPRLVVISGKAATLQVGGQIPIVSYLKSAEGTLQTVTYKDYGIMISVTPTIQDVNRVGLTLNVTKSDIDPAYSELADGIGFTTQSAQTYLLLDDQQTIVLAGLIKGSTTTSTNRVPGLSKIPLLGALFRHKLLDTPKDTEIVISIKPTILRGGKKADELPQPEELKMEPQQVDMPPEPEPVPVISKAPEVSVPGSGSQSYAASVQQKILSAIAYPYEAQEKGWQGTVRLALVIEKNGTLQSVVVKESSGYEVFDQDAVNTAQILAPYAAFPSDVNADDMTLTVPIVYSLDGFLQNVELE